MKKIDYSSSLTSLDEAIGALSASRQQYIQARSEAMMAQMQLEQLKTQLAQPADLKLELGHEPHKTGDSEGFASDTDSLRPSSEPHHPNE